MDVYYINHLNEKILLDSENVILKYQELFNYSWDADTDNGKITSFTREMATYPITVTVTADSDEEFADILNNFHSIVVKDIINHKPGRLYIGDQYLSCYISGDIKTDAFMGVPIQVKNLTVVTDHPFWIHEVSRSFQQIISGDTSSNGSFTNGSQECLPQNMEICLKPGTILDFGSEENRFRLE